MIKLFNTLTRKYEELITIDDRQCSMYVCGPTVYDFAHLGNLRAFIFSDILRRSLELNQYRVKEIMNITDVGHMTSDADEGMDKMEKGAEREKLSVWEIAQKYEKSFFEDLKKLNIEPATKYPKATEHINDQIEFIKKIESNGFTYKTADGLYFDTSKIKNYRILWGNKKDIGEQVSRIENKAYKKNPADFALWKLSSKGSHRAMEWPSPWGKGYPGWHIECSAMSTKYLGDEFDIHTGGVDHIPTHHTNEIAQSQAANGKNPARFWLHNEFLLVMDKKMAKSTGNYLTLKDITDKGYEPLAFRYLCLTTHYRSRLNFTWVSLDAAQTALKNIRNLKTIKSNINDIDREKYQKDIIASLNNDLDTPRAIATLHKTNDFQLWAEFEKVFALNLNQQVKIPENIIELARKRDEARKNRDFNLADDIRKEIEKKGFNVEDSESGTKIT